MNCTHCQTENTLDSKYCKECAAPLGDQASTSDSHTKTLLTIKPRLELGSIFADRYEIMEIIGKGGMGEVYRVSDTSIDEEMALKLLLPNIAAVEGTIKRFKNELKLARKIAHRNVCKMYDLNETDGTPFITMEYVAGEDLKSLINGDGRLTEEEVIGTVIQVCEGLAEAHKSGVIHRDLKPQNLMIDEKGVIKILDFGIARSMEARGMTRTGMMIGTPEYISPEQAEGVESDQRSDIYSLGVILYEMITGRVPFKGDTALSLALKHKTQIPLAPSELNPSISAGLSHVILKCMEKEKEKRYQTISELLRDLGQLKEERIFGAGQKTKPKLFRAMFSKLFS